jgi:hypothetical protein
MSATAKPCPSQFTRSPRFSILLVLLASACGVDPALEPAPVFPPSSTIGYAHGARLVDDPAAEFHVSTEGLVAEAERAIELGARIWGIGDDVLEGWTVAFQGGWFACQTRPTATWTFGCTHREQGWIQAGPDEEDCRTSVLVHEIGHVAIGDMEHRDPRWADSTKAERLACLP